MKIIANTVVVEMEVGSNLLQEIRRGQVEDEKVQEIKRNIKEEKSPGFSEYDKGVLWYKGRICVPNDEDINTLATIIPSIEILDPITRSRAQQLNH
jgi:hypothetical protein